MNRRTHFTSRATHLIFAAATAILVASPRPASATIEPKVTTRISTVSQGRSDANANWISTVQSVHANCGNALYIPFEDKEMFAVALSAQVGKLEVEVFYDKDATSEYFPGYGVTSSCRVVSLNIKYVA